MSVHVSIEPLAWESDFFSLPTARLNFSDGHSKPTNFAVLSQQMASYAIVQAKIAADRTDILDSVAALNFVLVEGEVDFSLMVGTENAYLNTAFDNQQLGDKYTIAVAKAEHIPVLRQAAERVFVNSRFRQPWYQASDSGRFYALWLEKAVLGTFDNICLLIKDPTGHLSGFVTLRHIDDDTARIGLLAAMPGIQNQGIGKKLMSAALQWCQQHQKKQLNVATQISNLAALRLYTRSGAQIAATAYWLYRGQHDPI